MSVVSCLERSIGWQCPTNASIRICCQHGVNLTPDTDAAVAKFANAAGAAFGTMLREIVECGVAVKREQIQSVRR